MSRIPSSSGELGGAGRRVRGGRSTLLRYWLFRLPGALAVAALLVLLVRGWDLEPRLAALFMALWMLKDLALYRFV